MYCDCASVSAGIGSVSGSSGNSFAYHSGAQCVAAPESTMKGDLVVVAMDSGFIHNSLISLICSSRGSENLSGISACGSTRC